MSIFVDPLNAWGWRIGGRVLPSCHLFTDAEDLAELHKLAAAIGLRRQWFQAVDKAPHYDLTPRRREAAIAAGALAVDRHQAVRIWRARRELLQRVREGRA